MPKRALSNGHDRSLLSDVSHLVHAVVHETKNLVGLEHRAEQTAKRIALDIAALGPYAEYYAAYQIAREINRLGAKGGRVGSLASHIIVLPLAKVQEEGLLGDVLIDLLKKEPKGIRDEGVRGPINPLHSFRFIPSPIRGGPSIYLPGLSKRKHGTHVDLEW